MFFPVFLLLATLAVFSEAGSKREHAKSVQVKLVLAQIKVFHSAIKKCYKRVSQHVNYEKAFTKRGLDLGDIEKRGMDLEGQFKMASYYLHLLKHQYMRCYRQNLKSLSSGINRCSACDYCLNGGHCLLSIRTNAVYCKCTSGFYGKRCESRKSDSPCKFTQKKYPHAFKVLAARKKVYKGYKFLVLKVRFPVNGRSRSENWCRDYQNLCANFHRRPTGCGPYHALRQGSTSSSYNQFFKCVTEYNSDAGIPDPSNTSLRLSGVFSCNPSGGIYTLAKSVFGSSGISSSNSFGFYICLSQHCQKYIKKSNSALYNTSGIGSSRIGYTVCH